MPVNPALYPFLLPFLRPHLVDGVDGRAETTVHAENIVVDDSREAQVIENLSAIAPHVHTAVLAQAFVVKTVDLRDLTTLVIAPDQGDPLRVPHFQGKEEQEGLDGVVSSVHEVAKEEVIPLWAVPAHFEQLPGIVRGDGRGGRNIRRMQDKDMAG